jgi:hypothetical protein
MADKLKQAIQLIKSGDTERARQLLIEKLKADPKNDTAWVWLATVVETAELKQECLEEALTHNPHNEVARRALAAMGRPPEPLPDRTPVATTPVTTTPTTFEAVEARPAKVPTRRRKINRLALPLFLLALSVIALTYIINLEELAYRNHGDVINATILDLDKAADANGADVCTVAYQFMAYGALRKGNSAFACGEWTQVEKSRMIRIEYQISQPDVSRYYQRPNNGDTLMRVGFGLGGVLVIISIGLVVYSFAPKKRGGLNN